MGDPVPSERHPVGHERFLALLEAVPDAIVALDRAGHMLFVNRQTEQLFGFRREELLGKPLEMLLPEQLRSLHAHHREDYYGEPRTRAMGSGLELTARRKDGSEFPVEVSLSPVPSAEGLWVISTVRDISERKQAERKIHQLNAELERRVAERTAELQAANEDLEAFVFSVSHDLRAPLYSVDRMVYLLLEDYGAQIPDGARSYLELVRQGTQQMEGLIAALLTLSRLSRQPLKKERVNMTGLVTQALETLNGNSVRPNLTIRLGDLPDAEADPILLKQVWINLLSNAIKYTRTREVAQILVASDQWTVGSKNADRSAPFNDHSQQPTHHSPLTTPAYPAPGQAVYYVKDNGVGFDAQHAEKLFGVFQRLHNEEEYEGTGVGLAIVQRIIRRHEGRVWAEAQPDQGATFFFTLGPSTRGESARR